MRVMICFGIAESCYFRWIIVMVIVIFNVMVIVIFNVMVMAIVVSVIDRHSRVSSLLRRGALHWY